MSAPTGRRRADDWKFTSMTKLSRRWLLDLAVALGYDPDRVISIRLNKGEAVVTFTSSSGMPRSVRHVVMGDPID